MGKQQMALNSDGMRKEIRLIDAIFLTAGGMIGSGIFIVSADVARNVGSAGWLIAIWVLGGFMTLIAALSYLELSSMFPRAGGQYVYLKEAYNPVVAFIYGWSLFAVVQTGTIAAVGVSFFKFLAYFIPQVGDEITVLSIGSYRISVAQMLAICLIALLTFVNSRGLKGGKIIQTVFTSTKVLSIVMLVVCGFVFYKAEVWMINWTDAWQLRYVLTDGSFSFYNGLPTLAGGIASGMVGAIMSYEAWNNATFVSSEVKNPTRNVGLSLFLGVLLVMVIYIALNLMFTAILPLTEIANAENDRVGLAASQAIFGEQGTWVVVAIILVATFGCNNGLILAGSRVYYTMAQDGLFLKPASRLNKHAVPAAALWFQCVMASILCLSGRYGDLLDMITFVAVLFYVLTVVGIFILRVKRPLVERTFKAFGYPILPAFYVILGLGFCILLIIYKPTFTWPGLLLALVGLPLYYLNKNMNK